jgi:hypothetical protein
MTCSGAQVQYVRLVKLSGGGGAWMGHVQLKGCGGWQSDCGSALSTVQSGGSFIANTGASSAGYQSWNNFLEAPNWACDSCPIGSYSTMQLDTAKHIYGWGMTNTQFHLEGSMTTDNFQIICRANHDCSGAKVLYVRMVKDASGGGPWNPPAGQFTTCE